MFFTYLGRVVAILVLVLGTFQIALGLLIADEVLLPYKEGLARYAPGKSSAGQVINDGAYLVAFSTVLGILTEISYALKSILKAQ
jgi:hypothetical protein